MAVTIRQRRVLAMSISHDSHRDVPRPTSSEFIPPANARGLAFSTLKGLLHEANLRPTRQRLALAAMIFGWGDRHFTAEMIVKKASGVRPRLSIATVYNALRQFSQAGLLREIAVFGSTTWYDTKTGPHCHLFIEETGDLIDIPDDVSRALPTLSVPDGFDLAGVDIIVRVRSKPSSAAIAQRG
jgi:Fur family iron response transcriptional regulator